MSAAPLAAGVALSLLAGVVRMRAWYAAIADACPGERIRYRDVVAAHFGGAGFNGVIPAHGGDAIKLGLLKRRFPNARFGLLLGSLGPPAALEAFCTSLLLAWALASGTIGAEWPGQIPLPLVGVGAALAAGVLWVLARRAPALLRDVRRGLAPLRRPRLLLFEIAPWVLVARTLRLGAIACFLTAVGLPVTFIALLLVMAVQTGVGGSIGASTAIRVAVLTAALPGVIGAHVSAEQTTTLLAGTQLTVMATSLTISVLVLGRTLRTASPRRVIAAARALRRGAAAPAPASEA